MIHHDPLSQDASARARPIIGPSTTPDHHRIVVDSLLVSNFTTHDQKGPSREDASVQPILLRHPVRSPTSHHWVIYNATVELRLRTRRVRPQERTYKLQPRAFLARSTH